MFLPLASGACLHEATLGRLAKRELRRWCVIPITEIKLLIFYQLIGQGLVGKMGSQLSGALLGAR